MCDVELGLSDVDVAVIVVGDRNPIPAIGLLRREVAAAVGWHSRHKPEL